MRENWYKTWFGREYLNLYAHRSAAEAEQQVALLLDALEPRQPAQVLDVACGAGRHLAELSRRGMRAWGLDLSEALLGEISLPGALVVRGDMRWLPFRSSCFDLLTSFFTSFGYFGSDEEHLSLLREWRRVLRKEGGLYLDYLNRERLLEGLVPETRRSIGGRSIVETRRISRDGLRVEKSIRIEDEQGAAVSEYLESVRLYSKAEMEGLLQYAGFRVKSVFGDYHGGGWSEQSPRLLLLAERIEV